MTTVSYGCWGVGVVEKWDEKVDVDAVGGLRGVRRRVPMEREARANMMLSINV